MKKAILVAASLIALAIVYRFAFAASAIEPSVGLYWTSNVDPTAGGGVCAPQWQILFRTDTQQIYFKSGATCTQWTALSASAANTVTGNGTNNTISKWTGAQTQGNSLATDDGTTYTITDNTSLGQALALTATITPANLNGTVNDYNPAGLSTTSLIRQGLTSSSILTGLTAQSAGTRIVIRNLDTAFTLTLNNEDGASAAANRFTLFNQRVWVIAPLSAVTLVYSGTTSRWTLESGPNFSGNFSAILMTSGSALDATTATVTIGGEVLVTGTTTALNGTFNDFSPFAGTTSIFRLNTTGTSTITGQSSGASGRQLWYQNAGAFVVTLTNQDAGSAAGNRFITPSGSSIPLAAGAILHMYYDGTQNRWLIDYVSTVGGMEGTSGSLTLWSTAAALGSYAGTGPCAAGSAMTTLSAAGVQTCSAFVTSATLTNNTIPKATAAGAIANSTLTDDATTTTVGDALVAGPTITTTDVGTQNDYAPTGIATAGFIRLNPASGLTITGITNGVAGRVLNICNVGAGNVSFTNESAGSTAANRIEAQQNNNLQLPTSTNANACLTLVYDGTSSRWRVVSDNTSTFNAALTLSGFTSSATGTFSGGAGIVLSSSAPRISTVGATAPTLSSCGTSPSIIGSDIAGRVTTGSAATTCTITFSATYTNAPACSVHSEGTATQPTYTTSATAITMSVDIASTVYDYVCVKVQ